MAPLEQDAGRAQWVFHLRCYALLGDGRLVFAAADRGRWRLYTVPAKGGDRPTEVVTPYTELGAVVRSLAGRAIMDVASPSRSRAIASVDVDRGDVEIIGHLGPPDLHDTRQLSLPEPVEFPTEDGAVSYGFFYGPRSISYRAPPDERPPLLVRVHGGPTAAQAMVLDYAVQFWTSRGFAVFDVNYRGSTGYGRAYRRRLHGHWGLVDVEDCCAGARFLAARDDVDNGRMVISGDSAGGYTALRAITTRDTFRAAAIYCGIADLEAFVTGTHKFESHYCDRLIGPWPKARETYLKRSPINYVDHMRTPVIFFHGDLDPVVPATQVARMVDAVQRRGLPCDYVAFPKEHHGFRSETAIERCLEAELAFYSRVLEFRLPTAGAP